MPLSFDFATERIHTLDDAVSAQTLIDGCRDAEASSVGIAYPQIASGEGKAPLGGAETGIVVKLLGGWKILSDKTDGSLSVSGGSVVRHDATSIFAANPLVQYENVLSQAGVGVPSVQEDTLLDIYRVLVSASVTGPNKKGLSFMDRFEIEKDPEEIRQYEINWEPYIGTGNDLSTCMTTIESVSPRGKADLIVQQQITSPSCVLTLSGGTQGVTYLLKMVATSGGETFVRRGKIYVKLA